MNLPALLEQAGARPRGGRYDCPDCGGRRTVAADESKGLFNCHHAGCGFKGGIGTLRKRCGLRREWLPAAEYRKRKTAVRAAPDLYECVRLRRFELLDQLHGWNELENKARNAGPDHQATWGALALVFKQRPLIVAELAVLEDSPAPEVARFIMASNEARQKAIERVLAGDVWIKRTMACLHCSYIYRRTFRNAEGMLIPVDHLPPGECRVPGCWRGCNGICLECSGRETVAVDVPLMELGRGLPSLGQVGPWGYSTWKQKTKPLPSSAEECSKPLRR
jgi:hypothetical protein